MSVKDTYEGADRFAGGVAILIGGLILLPAGLFAVGALDLPSILVVLVFVVSFALVVYGARELIQRRSSAGRRVTAEELEDFSNR